MSATKVLKPEEAQKRRRELRERRLEALSVLRKVDREIAELQQSCPHPQSAHICRRSPCETHAMDNWWALCTNCGSIIPDPQHTGGLQCHCEGNAPTETFFYP
jgi:hypothetical protein